VSRAAKILEIFLESSSSDTIKRSRSSQSQTVNPAASKDPAPEIDWSHGGGSKKTKIGHTEITYGIASHGQSGEVIVVKTPIEKRGQGSARTALTKFVSKADHHGTTLFLNSDPMDKTTSKSKLDKFYKSHGFIRNKGKNKDFSSRAEFIRQPKK